MKNDFFVNKKINKKVIKKFILIQINSFVDNCLKVMPPKKRTKGKAKNGDNSKKRKKRQSFSSSDDYESDSGAKSSDNNVFKDNNHNNNQHLDEDNGTDTAAEDQALMPILPEVSGRLLVCGGTNWDLIGRKELPKAAKNAPQTNSGLIFCLLLLLNAFKPL